MAVITQEMIDAASEAARRIDKELKIRYLRAGVYESADSRFAIHDIGWKRSEWLVFDRHRDCYVGEHAPERAFGTKREAIDAIKKLLRRETPECRIQATAEVA